MGVAEMTSDDKVAYLQSIGAPELLDRLVQTILEQAPRTRDDAIFVLRDELDKMTDNSNTVQVPIDRETYRKLQNINPDDAADAIRTLRRGRLSVA
ncbi:hypothetical protein DIPPA_33192 [Diplonema papillatum]|nr:hypothetical protein DIPPA_33192 [Diplonema papillatum]